MPPIKKTVTKKKEKPIKKLPVITGTNNILNLQKRKELQLRLEKLVKQTAKETKKIEPNKGVIFTIDLSKAKPGFCIGTDQGEILKCFSIPGNGKYKAKVILKAIEEILDEFNPELIIFEEVFQRFIKAASKLLIYKGLVYNVFLRHDIPTYELSNRTAKALFGVKTKEEVFAKVTSYLNLKLDFEEFNDEVDAILLYMVFLDSRYTNLKLID